MARERERRRQAARQAEQREQRRVRQEARKRLRRWLYLGASGVIAILITISLFLPSMTRGRTSTTNSSPGETFAILPATHIPDTTTYDKDKYNSVPPTSGPHWEEAAPWGISTEPVPNERQLHNLEHGGVMIQYKTEDAVLVTELENFAKKQTSYPCFLLVAPYPDMTYPVAVTAWGVRDTMTAYDEIRLQTFVDAYRDRGPEKVACVP